jgi:carbon storage regulator
MLVLSRRLNEEIVIRSLDGSKIIVRVCRIDGNKVRLGFEAPKAVKIDRREVDEVVEAKKLTKVTPEP